VPPLTPTRRRVAIFNDSVLTLSTMAGWCEMHGHGVFTAQISRMAMPHLNVERLVLANRPEVIVYDLAMPYESAWDFLEMMRLLPAVACIPFVLTTSNKVALESVVGPTQALQIIGKTDDRNELLRAIDTAVVEPVP
jgi:CheY-like chemotaxis protein